MCCYVFDEPFAIIAVLRVDTFPSRRTDLYMRSRLVHKVSQPWTSNSSCIPSEQCQLGNRCTHRRNKDDEGYFVVSSTTFRPFPISEISYDPAQRTQIHLQDDVLPTLELFEGFPVRTDEHQPDILHNVADIGMDKPRRIELWETHRYPAFRLSQSRGSFKRVEQEMQICGRSVDVIHRR